jgi:hypothetical protein
MEYLLIPRIKVQYSMETISRISHSGMEAQAMEGGGSL